MPRLPIAQLKEFATSELRVRHDERFRRRRSFVALVSILLVLAACGADGRSAADTRAIAIYSAAIRAAATQPIGNPPTVTRPGDIFVTGARSTIALSIQAGVAEKLESFATIRFVDTTSEAIDSGDSHKAVHDNGMLLTLGAIGPGRADATVTVQRYERVDRTATLTVALHRSGSVWLPVATTGA